MKPAKKVILYRGDHPWELVTVIGNRPLVGHNAWNFDRLIWDRFIGPGINWLDSMYLARINARPAKLDSLSKAVFGEGKDRAKKLLPLLTTAFASDPDLYGSEVRYPLIRPGDLQAFMRYGIGDVEIISRYWYEECKDTPVEVDVINAHQAINERGVAVDSDLLETLEDLSHYSVEHATREIEALTDGAIHAGNIRSVPQMHDWLASYGVYIHGNDLDKEGNKKLTLRKEAVQRFLDSPYIIEEFLVGVREVPPLVLEVLKLRMKALRITDAKVHRARERTSDDGRIRDLHTYHAAHTGRFSSYGVQIHNLPTAKTVGKLSIEDTVKLIKSTAKQFPGDIAKVYETVQKVLPPPEPGKPYVSVDDVCSVMIRPCFVGNKLALVDFSQVESRGLAWIAEEQKLLDIYTAHGDPYRTFAGRVYGIAEESVSKEQRDGVGKVGILALGYGMGPPKFRIYAANYGVDLVNAGVTAEQMVELYRNEYIHIAGFKPDRNANFRVQGLWQKFDKAVKDCVANRTTHHVGKCIFYMKGPDLVCILPSGRWILYPDARIEDVVPPYCYTLGLPLVPKATVIYTSARGPKSLYGGIITENVVQALCRDLLAEALVRVEAKGLCTVLHVHDEIVCEVPPKHAEARLRDIVAIMSQVPAWAEGFPLACEGFLSPRFVKKAFTGAYSYSTKDLVNGNPTNSVRSKPVTRNRHRVLSV